jgi:serine/threonine protein kinase
MSQTLNAQLFVVQWITYRLKWFKVILTLIRLICGLLASLHMNVSLKSNFKIFSINLLYILFAPSVLVGSAPFHHDDYDVTYRKIMKVEYKVPSHVSKAAAHLIACLLVFDPNRRMTLEQIAIHPWFSVN